MMQSRKFGGQIVCRKNPIQIQSMLYRGSNIFSLNAQMCDVCSHFMPLKSAIKGLNKGYKLMTMTMALAMMMMMR
jgi:hypothetical protein